MNEVNPNGIGEIIEPAPLSFEFGAPGWYMLAVAVLLIGLIISFKAYLTYKKNKYRRMAVQELQSLVSANNNKQPAIYNFVLMLKKVAIISYGKPLVGNLFGKEFYDFLKTKITTKDLFKDQEEIFSKNLYQQENLNIEHVKINAFYEDSIYWIKKHHV